MALNYVMCKGFLQSGEAMDGKLIQIVLAFRLHRSFKDLRVAPAEDFSDDNKNPRSLQDGAKI